MNQRIDQLAESMGQLKEHINQRMDQLEEKIKQ
jgi:hypothetical protein